MVDSQEAFNKVAEIIGSQKTSKKKQGLAKTISLVLLVAVFIIGVVGSFEFAHFNMDSYAKFLEIGMWPLMLLITSVGAGSIVQPKKESKKDCGEEK